VNSDKKYKKENDSPLDNKYTFRCLLHTLYVASQVLNTFVTRNPNSTKLNTLCRCHTWLITI